MQSQQENVVKLISIGKNYEVGVQFSAKQKFSPQESEASFWKFSFLCHPQDSKQFYFVTHTSDTSQVRLIFASQKIKPIWVYFYVRQKEASHN